MSREQDAIRCGGPGFLAAFARFTKAFQTDTNSINATEHLWRKIFDTAREAAGWLQSDRCEIQFTRPHCVMRCALEIRLTNRSEWISGGYEGVRMRHVVGSGPVEVIFDRHSPMAGQRRIVYRRNAQMRETPTPVAA